MPKYAKIIVINELSMEEYLYGVVPRELSTTHPIEALKAQAVCARTYASRNIGSYSKYGFDRFYNVKLY